MTTKAENSARALQQAYYTRTASQYAERHESPDTAHDRALRYIDSLLDGIGVTSVLDVGAGTGRAVRYFRGRRPGVEVRGIEPVEGLIQEAERFGAPPGAIVAGDGTSIPFEDDSFDVATCFGVLHHVRHPEQVLREMMRVARKAVFVSDSNRFAQGRPLARYVKLALGAAGLWPAFDFLRTGGKRYMVSEGDGVFYSYSVFDSLRLLRSWAPELMLFELESASQVAGTWGGPLCNAPTILVGAVKR